MSVQIINADCLFAMDMLQNDSVDSIVTDPPYELGFMGKGWDASGVAYDVGVWREALRVLKPGGHLLAFGSSRTSHHMVCAIEDAGFEIRDTILWLYGSGFPKSKNLDGEWEGWGTALKPAHEPITMARKPLVGTVAANVLQYGTGALNIDACRVATDGNDDGRWGNGTRPGGFANVGADKGTSEPCGHKHDAGRWPANVIHDGSEEVLRAFPIVSSGQPTGIKTGGQGNAFGLFAGGIPVTGYGDTGSAARFFYCAKASKADRDAGNTHPTVKPTALMRYLCRLVTPPGGLVLDPFCGSGSTGKAAVAEGFGFIGIEREPEYAAIARARCA